MTVTKQCSRARSGFFAVLLLVTLIGCAHAGENTSDSKAFGRFAEHMAARYGFDAKQIERLLAQSERQEDILAAIASPAEALPWYRYRSIFLKEPRIRLGVKFWEQHAAVLERASQRYGVPPQVIVAIIGVESRYGRNRGNHRVIDALRTLAFDYPPRSEFFRSELEQYLLLSREEGFDPLQPEGSYAGAMGIPQFISSSYRMYAVDFNHDGHRDLWDQPADAIGSIANYFSEHGWQRGEAVAVPASMSGEASWSGEETPELTTNSSVGELLEHGVRVERTLSAAQPASLIILEDRQGSKYWVGLPNFYVITRYNHSVLYAMAVYQLSQAIDARRGSTR
ncbi:MAG: lytic murein transglycosylase B [Nitrococcus sp.]|nr:lytic murein transglycosylase B [Nitrococcus sp.]